MRIDGLEAFGVVVENATEFDRRDMLAVVLGLDTLINRSFWRRRR